MIPQNTRIGSCLGFTCSRSIDLFLIDISLVVSSSPRLEVQISQDCLKRTNIFPASGSRHCRPELSLRGDKLHRLFGCMSNTKFSSSFDDFTGTCAASDARIALTKSSAIFALCHGFFRKNELFGTSEYSYY